MGLLSGSNVLVSLPEVVPAGGVSVWSVLPSISPVQAATREAPNRIARVFPKRVIGLLLSELDEGVGGEDAEDQVLHLEAVLGKRVELCLDGRLGHSHQLIDDVFLALREVP